MDRGRVCGYPWDDFVGSTRQVRSGRRMGLSRRVGSSVLRESRWKQLFLFSTLGASDSAWVGGLRMG